MKAVTMEDRMYSTCRAISSPFTNRDNSGYSLLMTGDAETISTVELWSLKCTCLSILPILSILFFKFISLDRVCCEYIGTTLLKCQRFLHVCL